MRDADQPQLSDFMAGPADGGLLASEHIDRILDTVRKHLGVEIAFMSRFTGEERELLNVRSEIDLPMGPGFREPKEDSYCWQIAQGRLPQLIQDPKDHPFTEELAITHMLPVGCHLNVPLRLSDGSLYGSFCALSREPDRSMTERDLGILRAFAELAIAQIEGEIESSARHETLSVRIRQVIEAGQLTIVHQPIHSLVTGRPVGVECLARFPFAAPDAPQRGPDVWFDEAAEVGLGLELELLAVRTALASLPYVPDGFYASINASPETILSGALEPLLEGIGHERLVIEVTEHNRVADYAALMAALASLKRHARIAIDDVGAGYAGLRHLVDLQPDILKLDMSLTSEIHRDPARQALAGAMIQFSSAIGAKLIAEGIETPEERDTLAALGATMGQGWFFARPMPVVAAQQWLMGAGSAREEPDSPSAPLSKRGSA